jgi:hypothetical protein
LRESFALAVDDDVGQMATESYLSCKSETAKRKLHVCCSYSETGIIAVLKSVARIRLVVYEKRSTCVTVNCKVLSLPVVTS